MRRIILLAMICSTIPGGTPQRSRAGQPDVDAFFAQEEAFSNGDSEEMKLEHSQVSAAAPTQPGPEVPPPFPPFNAPELPLRPSQPGPFQWLRENELPPQVPPSPVHQAPLQQVPTPSRVPSEEPWRSRKPSSRIWVPPHISFPKLSPTQTHHDPRGLSAQPQPSPTRFPEDFQASSRFRGFPPLPSLDELQRRHQRTESDRDMDGPRHGAQFQFGRSGTRTFTGFSFPEWQGTRGRTSEMRPPRIVAGFPGFGGPGDSPRYLETFQTPRSPSHSNVDFQQFEEARYPLPSSSNDRLTSVLIRSTPTAGSKFFPIDEARHPSSSRPMPVAVQWGPSDSRHSPIRQSEVRPSFVPIKADGHGRPVQFVPVHRTYPDPATSSHPMRPMEPTSPQVVQFLPNGTPTSTKLSTSDVVPSKEKFYFHIPIEQTLPPGDVQSSFDIPSSEEQLKIGSGSSQQLLSEPGRELTMNPGGYEQQFVPNYPVPQPHTVQHRQPPEYLERPSQPRVLPAQYSPEQGQDAYILFAKPNAEDPELRRPPPHQEPPSYHQFVPSEPQYRPDTPPQPRPSFIQLPQPQPPQYESVGPLPVPGKPPPYNMFQPAPSRQFSPASVAYPPSGPRGQQWPSHSPSGSQMYPSQPNQQQFEYVMQPAPRQMSGSQEQTQMGMYQPGLPDTSSSLSGLSPPAVPHRPLYPPPEVPSHPLFPPSSFHPGPQSQFPFAFPLFPDPGEPLPVFIPPQPEVAEPEFQEKPPPRPPVNTFCPTNVEKPTQRPECNWIEKKDVNGCVKYFTCELRPEVPQETGESLGSEYLAKTA